MPTCKLTKKALSHILLHILPSFSKNTSRLLLPKSLWECASTISFRKYKRITCNLPVQLQFLQVKFLHVEDAIGSFLEYSFYFYFDICIKFTLALVISTMKKWLHLTWCVPFYDKNKKNVLERKKAFHHSKIKSFKY